LPFANGKGAVICLSMDRAEDCGHLHGFGDPNAKRSRLQEIAQQRERDVEEAKAARPKEAVARDAEEFVKEFGRPQALVECLSAAEASGWGLALAAEFKRASPSKGDINVDLDAAGQALEYCKAGASVLSVLTEPKWFKGSLKDLRDVRLRTQRWAEECGEPRPACLRKDFVVDEYQVLEALAHGADTILLMVSILSKTRLQSLIAKCRELGLEPLVEVVTERELQVALDTGARVIGVNNRNLHTFELDKTRTAQLGELLQHKFKVPFGRGTNVKLLALSGFSTPEDVSESRKISCSGVLVGESLMRSSDVADAILELMGGPKSGNADGIASVASALPVKPGAVIVKVCGIVRPEDARCAVGSGANLIGVIFAESKRKATVEQARAVVDVVRRFGERSDRISPCLAEANACATAAVAHRSAQLRNACKRTPLVVGVFMNQSIPEIEQLAQESCIDAIQLHGREDVEFVSQLRTTFPDTWILKVVHIPPRSDGTANGVQDHQEELRTRLLSYAELCDGLLLDTSVAGSASGGTGATFDWEIVRLAQQDWKLPVIVAGGLTAANAGELVSSVQPFGVDVASGVEDSPGVKNKDQVKAYVQAAKRARS